MKQKQKKAAERITGDDYVAYLRVSSKGQVNTDYNPEGVSIPAQRTKVEERGQELGSTKAATKLLQAQCTKQLRALDTKESNLIDLAADGALPQDKIRARLHEITRQRKRLTERLADTDQDLSMAGRSSRRACSCFKIRKRCTSAATISSAAG